LQDWVTIRVDDLKGALRTIDVVAGSTQAHSSTLKVGDDNVLRISQLSLQEDAPISIHFEPERQTRDIKSCVSQGSREKPPDHGIAENHFWVQPTNAGRLPLFRQVSLVPELAAPLSLVRSLEESSPHTANSLVV